MWDSLLTCTGWPLGQAGRYTVPLQGWLLWGEEPGVCEGCRHQGRCDQGATGIAELQGALVGHGHRDRHGKVGGWDGGLDREQRGGFRQGLLWA